MKHSGSKMESRKRLVLIAAAAAVVAALVFAVVLVRIRSSRKAPYQIVFIPKVVDEENDFWKALLEGAQAGAKEYGIELAVEAPDAEDNHAMQSEILRETAKQRPDAVILAPTSYTQVTEAAREVVQAGIPLILVDSTLDERLEKSLIATDNLEAGRRMAECIKPFLPESPVIGIVAHVQGSSTAMEREQGLREGLAGYEDCIVGTVFTNSDYQQGYDVTMELLDAHPDINVLMGLNEYSAVGAARAVQDCGMSDRITMVGFDSSLEEIGLLESGLFRGIVVQKPFNMGYLSVETAVKVIQGETVPAYTDSGSQAVTKSTMYSEENQKLLFLFREGEN